MTDSTVPTEAEPRNTVTLGFVRGIAPSRWQTRWNEVRSRRRLDLVPLEQVGDVTNGETDMTLVRCQPGEFPAGSRTEPRTRHAVQLYEEAVALVVDTDHELAGEASIDVSDLDLVHLLDYEGHSAVWPTPQPWDDPSWRPTDPRAALELVATGIGTVLMPLPLARHMIAKKQHSIIEVTGEIDGTRVFATWNISRDDDEMQELMGVLRGRTARSSR